MSRLLIDVDRINKNFNKSIDMTKDDESNFHNATYCYLCKNPLVKDEKVRNHYHITGQYLGAAHNNCNNNLKILKHVPVFLLNLSGYDYHHLMQELGKYQREDIHRIATIGECYIVVLLDWFS